LKTSFAVNPTSIFVTIVLTALATYFLTTQFSVPVKEDIPREIKTAQSTSPALETGKTTGRLGSVDTLLIGLKQRLEAQQDDIDGWILLSKSYYHINRLVEANEAFEKAKALGYAGNWMPLPRIDSFMGQESTSQKLRALANFRDNKIGEDAGQIDAQ